MKAAEKIARMMKENLSQLDPWIENDLTNKFLTERTNSVLVRCDDTSLVACGVSHEGIITKLKSEGFHVKYIYAGRIGSSLHYEITIPQ